MRVIITKLTHASDLSLPAYATDHSAGMDLLAAITDPITLKPGKFTLVPTGISIALEPKYEAQVRPRSGLALKYGVTTLNSPGTIDADYRGEVGVVLINHGHSDFLIERGMRIAQMVVAKHEKVKWQEADKLSETLRGDGGFGSTGHN